MRAAASVTASVVLAAASALAGSARAQQAAGTSPAASAAVAHPGTWPTLPMKLKRDPKVETRVDGLLRRMTLEDKVGQLIEVDIGSITPKDVETFKFGSILNGGNSGPYGDDHAAGPQWLKLADEFWDANAKRSDGRAVIPLIWGTDAVHGDNNIPGATIFPHNIGLGAMRDPSLVKRIGRATAEENAATGLDWSFAPTVAVVQDDRWGRTYESYSEEPSVVASYASAMVEGLQGTVGKDFMGPGHVISSVKHFLGDGGTGGRDQGDTRVSEATLRDVHAAGYTTGLAAGALIVMPSFSSWNGAKMTANKSLLTGVLKERWGFQGFAVTDWNAHASVPGCTAEDCPAAIDAGVDMFMYSGPKWRDLYANTLAEAKDGRIPAARLDDAVRRILRVKVLAGTFDAGRPSSRPLAGHFDLIGSPAHRAIAREAVAKSLVLLKNDGVLPLNASATVLVAGKAADDVSQATGGWTVTWQGTDLKPGDLAGATSIWKGVHDAVVAGDGKAILSADGSFAAKPDVAVVVFGETPYAEFVGDRPTLEYSPDDKSDLALLRKLKAAGVPTVAVFLSGRPLWVNPELNAADAFVAAWLPGSEGEGVADVLVGDAAGRPRRDFTGTLGFSWPRRLDQYVLNRRDPDYDPLFPFGYGLTYARPSPVPNLDETRPSGSASDPTQIFVRGRIAGGARLALSGAVAQARVDRDRQEDTLQLTWTGAGRVAIEEAKPIELERETNGELSLVVNYRLATAPTAPVRLGMTGGGHEAFYVVNSLLTAAPGTWGRLAVPLHCFRDAGAEMAKVSAALLIDGGAGLRLDLSQVRVQYGPPGTTMACPAR